MKKLLTPLAFKRGPKIKNRFMMAPMTTVQSHEDGILSDEELHWLALRAKGGFGLVTTCACHVQEIGRGFHGQLGSFSDNHVDGLTRLADAIRSEGSVSSLQLHHAGLRSPEDVIGATPVSASDDAETGARALTTEEVYQLRDDFIAAAMRCDRAGIDGVQLHGGHGYILEQFFSKKTNRRQDEYGGPLENRYRILDEIIDGIRHNCRADFQLSVRLAAEQNGLDFGEVLTMAGKYLNDDRLDLLDMSLWDVFKEPEDEAYHGKSLLAHFAELERGNVALGVAGNIRSPGAAEAVIDHVDCITLGRAAILMHDFPIRYANNHAFDPVTTPVTRQYLKGEGLSDKFVDYMGQWPGFLEESG